MKYYLVTVAVLIATLQGYALGDGKNTDQAVVEQNIDAIDTAVKKIKTFSDDYATWVVSVPKAINDEIDKTNDEVGKIKSDPHYATCTPTMTQIKAIAATYKQNLQNNQTAVNNVYNAHKDDKTTYTGQIADKCTASKCDDTWATTVSQTLTTVNQAVTDQTPPHDGHKDDVTKGPNEVHTQFLKLLDCVLNADCQDQKSAADTLYSNIAQGKEDYTKASQLIVALNATYQYYEYASSEIRDYNGKHEKVDVSKCNWNVNFTTEAENYVKQLITNNQANLKALNATRQNVTDTCKTTNLDKCNFADVTCYTAQFDIPTQFQIVIGNETAEALKTMTSTVEKTLKDFSTKADAQLQCYLSAINGASGMFSKSQSLVFFLLSVFVAKMFAFN